MEVGKHLARILDYGVSKTKSEGVSVFIKFRVGLEESMWYGSPFKKDGEANDMCMQQLAEAGFDLVSHTFDDLNKGIGSNVLIESEDIVVSVADKTMGDGTQKRVIDFVGERGVNKISDQELKAIVSDEKLAKLKASASKFKPKKRKATNEVIPF